MTYEQRQYATGGILLIMVAVAAFILGIAYQNNKPEIKNRIAPLLGQMQTIVDPDRATGQEETMVNRKKAQFMQMKYCKMHKNYRDLEQRVERLERMQMMPMTQGYEQGNVVPTYPAIEYPEASEAQVMPMAPQFSDIRTIEFRPMEQGQGTIMLRRGN